jgi:hypothetical protein
LDLNIISCHSNNLSLEIMQTGSFDCSIISSVFVSGLSSKHDWILKDYDFEAIDAGHGYFVYINENGEEQESIAANVSIGELQEYMEIHVFDVHGQHYIYKLTFMWVSTILHSINIVTTNATTGATSTNVYIVD